MPVRPTNSREIDEQLGLIKPGYTVVDLGSTPGAWSQYVRRRLSPRCGGGQLNGCIISLDILPMEPIEGVTFLNGDFREPEVLERLEQALAGRVVDVVVSDMAPNLSGIESADAARIAHLVELAVDFAVPTSSRWRFGGEAVSWQWVQRSGQLVQADLQGGKALEAESIAG